MLIRILLNVLLLGGIVGFQNPVYSKSKTCMLVASEIKSKLDLRKVELQKLSKKAQGQEELAQLISESQYLETELRQLFEKTNKKGNKFSLKKPTCKRDYINYKQILTKIDESHKSIKLKLKNKTTAPEKKKIYVLVLDGGGVRGIIGARIIQALEEKTGRKITEMFDYFAGTSTGGLLALLLNIKGTDGKAKYTGKQAVRLYQMLSKTVFQKNKVRTVKTLGGLIRAKFSVKPLEALLKSHQFLGSTPLRDSVKKLMIVAWDTVNSQNYVFDSDYSSALMWEAGRGTSAAPTFFKAFDYRGRILVDGGISDNSPGLVAYRKLKKQYPKSEIIMISLGTVYYSGAKRIKTSGAFAGGVFQSAKLVITDLFQSAQWNSDENLKTLLGGNYIRITPQLSRDIPLDGKDSKTMNELLQAGESMIGSPSFNKALDVLQKMQTED